MLPRNEGFCFSFLAAMFTPQIFALLGTARLQKLQISLSLPSFFRKRCLPRFSSHHLHSNGSSFAYLCTLNTNQQHIPADGNKKTSVSSLNSFYNVDFESMESRLKKVDYELHEALDGVRAIPDSAKQAYHETEPSERGAFKSYIERYQKFASSHIETAVKMHDDLMNNINEAQARLLLPKHPATVTENNSEVDVQQISLLRDRLEKLRFHMKDNLQIILADCLLQKDKLEAQLKKNQNEDKNSC